MSLKKIQTENQNETEEIFYKNEWDKGHLAPAATFSDSEENLNKTFSFINCAMQIDDLNRGEWAQLEQQVRDWSASLGSIRVRIELVFDPGHEVRETGVHIPTGFWKNLTYPNGERECYYFPNEPTNKNWDGYLSDCQQFFLFLKKNPKGINKKRA